MHKKKTFLGITGLTKSILTDNWFHAHMWYINMHLKQQVWKMNGPANYLTWQIQNNTQEPRVTSCVYRRLLLPANTFVPIIIASSIPAESQYPLLTCRWRHFTTTLLTTGAQKKSWTYFTMRQRTFNVKFWSDFTYKAIIWTEQSDISWRFSLKGHP